jgi:biopolymer transport protein ExbD
MAELDTGEGGGKKKSKVRSKKSNPRIDMTAMVDLAFLLLTFFVLTTSINKPNVMPVVIPPKTDGKEVDPPKVAESKILNVVLGDKDKVYYYTGLLNIESNKLPEILTTNYAADGLRKVLFDRKKDVAAQFGNEKELIVLIKPSDKARYANIVDVLDEMNITEVKKYTLADLSDDEKKEIIEKLEPAEPAGQ